MNEVERIQRAARLLRRNILTMVGVGQKGHFGGSCSSADVVATLYFSRMRHDPKNPHWAGRDRFLLSKGHAALVQYAVGGLASLISYVFRGSGLPMECIGVKDDYGQSAENFQLLLEEYELIPRHIAAAVRKVATENA